MKDYLNATDRNNLMIIYGVTDNIEKLIDSGLLTTEETTRLKSVKTATENAIMGVLNRLGDTAKRKVVLSAQSNVIVMQGKYEARKELISHIAVEDMQETVNEFIALQCLNCRRCDFKECASYKMAVACDIPIKHDDRSGCPYRSSLSDDVIESDSLIKEVFDEIRDY